MFTRAGTARHKEGDRGIELGRPLMTPPAMDRVIDASAGFVSTQIHIPQTSVDTVFHALTGTDRHIEFALSAPANVGVDIERFLEFLMGEADRTPNAVWTPTVAERWVETILQLLVVAWPHNHSSAFEKPSRAAEPRYLRRAEEYLAQYADRAITYAELAKQSGASVRALQSAFRAHRNSSPMAFLRERRFQLVRSRLLAGRADSVAAVALECGFTHLGRFSHEYRVRFGESPSQTLKRNCSSTPLAQSAAQKP